MKCPKCHSTKFKTSNSRSTKSGYQTWRRKQCQSCNEVITTYEKPDLAWISIENSLSGQQMPYKRYLLTISILNAFESKSTPEASIDDLVETMEIKLIKQNKPIVSSQELVAIVLKTLKPVNLNAYMHYLAAHTTPHNQRELAKLINEI